MENYKGRYVKVLKKNLGGLTSYYNTGDYLKVIEDKGNFCIEVEYAGILNVRAFKNRITSGDIEMMPVGFTPEFILPENWHVDITDDNYDILSKYFEKIHPYSTLYKKGIMGKYSETNVGMLSYGNAIKTSSYDFGQKITLEQFKTYVLKIPTQSKTFPILHSFPNEGCCNTTDKVFIDFLIKNFGITDSKTRSKNATAVGWNSKSYWYLIDVKSSGKPRYDISQLEPFYKKESYSDFIERIKKEEKKEQKEKQLILKNVNHEYTEERRQESSNSTKICGFDIKIRQADPIRGISLRSSKSKIRIGSNNSNY